MADDGCNKDIPDRKKILYYHVIKATTGGKRLCLEPLNYFYQGIDIATSKMYLDK